MLNTNPNLASFRVKLKDFTFKRWYHDSDVFIVLYLAHVTWADLYEIKEHTGYGVVTYRRRLPALVKYGYVRIARHAQPKKGISNKYCITNKGRDFIERFFKHLNS